MTEARPEDRSEPPREVPVRADVDDVLEQPAAEAPAAEQPAAEQPAAEQPAAEQPGGPGTTDDGPSSAALVEHVVPRRVVRDVDPEDWSRSGGSDDERYLRERPPHW